MIEPKHVPFHKLKVGERYWVCRVIDSQPYPGTVEWVAEKMPQSNMGISARLKTEPHDVIVHVHHTDIFYTENDAWPTVIESLERQAEKYNKEASRTREWVTSLLTKANEIRRRIGVPEKQPFVGEYRQVAGSTWLKFLGLPLHNPRRGVVVHASFANYDYLWWEGLKHHRRWIQILVLLGVLKLVILDLDKDKDIWKQWGKT